MLQAPTVCNDIQFKAKGNTMEAHSAADEAWHWLNLGTAHQARS